MHRKKNARPRIVAGYVRVSTEEQATSGVSIAAQRDRLEAFAKATDRPLQLIFADEGRSGSTLDRPGLRDLLELVNGHEVREVLVLKLDRLTRSIRDLCGLLEQFRRADTALVSTMESIDTGSASGRLIVHIVGVISQFEREQIGERTSIALQHLKRHGLVYGHVPFGYRRQDKALVEDAEEQHALQCIRAMRATGASLRQVGVWLTIRGFKPPQGGALWHANSVRKMLMSASIP